jgi:hypothetical protein
MLWTSKGEYVKEKGGDKIKGRNSFGATGGKLD